MAVAPLLPTRTELVPWTDRRGRFHPLRAVVLALLCLPGLVLLSSAALGRLGAEPVTTAIHSTGYWAVWIMVASLVISPVKALAGSTNIVVVRRMIGNAAMAYSLAHLLLYAADQKWKLGTVVAEIVSRFYLTVGFVSLLGLLVLAFTSTDGFIRQLGRTWKRLHRLAYPIMALALFHYVLQSKLDVSQALLAFGVFAWLMLWRLLPAGRDRDWPALLGTTLAAAVVTLAVEYLWYRFGTRINPEKVVMEEFDIALSVHPAGQVLILGLVATGLVVLHRTAGTSRRVRAVFPALLYAGAAAAMEAAPWLFGVQLGDLAFDAGRPWTRAAAWIAALFALGLLRPHIPEGWRRNALDAALPAALLLDMLWLTAEDAAPVRWAAGAAVLALLALAATLRPTPARALLLLLPPLTLLAWQATA